MVGHLGPEDSLRFLTNGVSSMTRDIKNDMSILRDGQVVMGIKIDQLLSMTSRCYENSPLVPSADLLDDLLVTGDTGHARSPLSPFSTDQDDGYSSW